jgi:hypothetical protein
MRDQYAGDISDLIKLSLLRALAGEDRTLGVAWYYAPGDDGRSDGKHVEHRAESDWQALDPAVHDALATFEARSVAALEGLSVWPAHTVFHRCPVERSNRDAWVHGMRTALDEASLVFLDPDNGLGLHWEKHARVDDLRALRRDGRALMVIKFPGRSSTHHEQVRELHGDLRDAGFKDILTLRTSVSVPSRSGSRSRLPRARFFTLVGADAQLKARAQAFAERMSSVRFARARLDLGD